MTIKLSNLKHFKQGVIDMTPEQQNDIKITSSIGTLVGFTLAFSALLYKILFHFDIAQLGFVIVLFFAVILTAIQLIGFKQQKKQFKLLNNFKEQIMESGKND